MSERYAVQELVICAAQLLEKSGLSAERAAVVAEILVEADLMGHSTHGLAQLAPYLRELDAGLMATEGEPTVIADHGSAITWDGGYLPGPWLVVRAMELAMSRIADHPVVTVAIQRSHHIACLAAYPKRATDRGLFMLLSCSDPTGKSVAPYGGIQPLYTPDPLAAGIPTRGAPIIIDISTSTTAMGYVSRLNQQGQHFPHPWLLDNQGNPSDNPADVFSDPPGSILPLGGMDLGYKGFALGLLVEAMTSALAGSGRADQPKRWGCSVFLQIINPEAFGGLKAFTQETEWLAEASRNNPTRPGDPPVRLPGSRALQLRAEQMQNGVALHESILPALKPWLDKLGVALPAPIRSA